MTKFGLDEIEVTTKYLKANSPSQLDEAENRTYHQSCYVATLA